MNIKNSTKQVFKHSTLMVLAAAMSLSSCKDKEVAPKTDTDVVSGYEKAFENGFVKGTIKGVRKDGTPFEEPFEYKLTSDQAAFEKTSATEHTLRLARFKTVVGGNNYVRLNLTVTNRDQAGATAKINGGYLSFSKVLTDRNVFSLSAGTNFDAEAFTLPMSRANNATYKLVDNGRYYNYSYDEAAGQNYYTYKDTDGNTIHFSTWSTRDIVTGDSYYAFSHIVNSTGVRSTTSSVWSNVRVMFNENGRRVFMTSAGANLSETLQVPGDTREITNFAYNAATGVITFDYKLNISEFRAYDQNYNNGVSAANTTMHALEIKGSVSATVYNSTVMRKSAL